jgi:hypothetical protein
MTENGLWVKVKKPVSYIARSASACAACQRVTVKDFEDE